MFAWNINICSLIICDFFPLISSNTKESNILLCLFYLKMQSFQITEIIEADFWDSGHLLEVA